MMQATSDVRFDEDYARFYALYSGQRKLPPPVEGRTLYQDVPGLYNAAKLQQAQQMLAAPVAGGPMLSRGITPGEAASGACAAAWRKSGSALVPVPCWQEGWLLAQFARR